MGEGASSGERFIIDFTLAPMTSFVLRPDFAKNIIKEKMFLRKFCVLLSCDQSYIHTLHWYTLYTLHCPTLDNKELYITIEENAYCITSNRGVLRISEVSDLQSHQEEADTKMFLCASYASILGFERVKIITVDTDVAILALYFQSKLDISIYMEIGTGSKVHYLILRQIQSMMKLKMCCLLFMPFRVAIQQAPLVALGK